MSLRIKYLRWPKKRELPLPVGGLGQVEIPRYIVMHGHQPISGPVLPRLAARMLARLRAGREYAGYWVRHA